LAYQVLLLLSKLRNSIHCISSYPAHTCIQSTHAPPTHATDQADILEHREEQVKAAEARCGELAGQLERVRADLGQCNDDIGKLKVG
jgi:hypothetical protein